MAAGTSYSRRYGGGFVDKPSTASPIDAAFLNAVENALLQLFGAAPTADGQVAQWDNVNTRYGPALLLNKNIDPAAAIAKSKLDFSGANGITNTDIAGSAAIARSKLDFGAGLVNGDVSSSAAIAWSKIAPPTLQTYTPTLTNFTTGAGSVQGFYVQFGRICAVCVQYVSGAGATFGASPFGVSFPVLPIVNSDLAPIGHGMIGSNAGGGLFEVSWAANSFLKETQSAYTQVIQGTPMTLTATSPTSFVNLYATYLTV